MTPGQPPGGFPETSSPRICKGRASLYGSPQGYPAGYADFDAERSRPDCPAGARAILAGVVRQFSTRECLRTSFKHQLGLQTPAGTDACLLLRNGTGREIAVDIEEGKTLIIGTWQLESRIQMVVDRSSLNLTANLATFWYLTVRKNPMSRRTQRQTRTTRLMSRLRCREWL